MEIGTPWVKKNVLTLNGGGLRGLGPLLILQSLMKEIKDIELSKNSEATSSAYSTIDNFSTREDFQPPAYRPCHYFDYVGGSGTGGMVALMLGRFRMSVDDAVMLYWELCTNLKDESLFRVRMPWTKSIDGALMRHYEKVITALHPLFPSPHEVYNKFTSDPTRCKTVICSMRSCSDKRFKEPFLFHSYNDKSDDEDLGLWEVAQATSPAPFNAEPVVLGSALYYDASEYIHNSTVHILDEIERAQGRPDAVETLLSIGVVSSKDEGRRKWRGRNNLGDQDRPCPDRIHKSIKARSRRWSFQHHRLDLPVRLNTNYLNKVSSSSDCKEVFEKVQRITTNFLAQDYVQAHLRRIAETLVNIRLRRAQTMEWERFANGVIYRCPVEGCPQPSSRFEFRCDLLDHLRMVHDQPPPDNVHHKAVKEMLDQGRTNIA